MAGSGVRSEDPEGEKEFHQYEQFLNSAYLNLAAGEIHDYFNRTGVTVTNKADQQFIVGGDGHMLSIQSEAATLVAIQANTLADQAISDILATGTSSVKVEEDIFKLFPTKVVLEEEPEPVGLEQWNDTFVRSKKSSTQSSRTCRRAGSTRSSERWAASSSATRRCSRRRIPEAVPMVGGEAGAIPAIARRDAHDADIAEDAVREPFVRCCAAIGARIPRAVIT